jgi:DHA2 family multidrug resistance protein
LLRERNFSLAVVFYFLFGFVLFGSTTMIPEILQNLYGYSATDAGLVLGPGAAVITLLAPFVARVTQKGNVSPRMLIAFSFTVVAFSMLYYGHFTLQTDYFHYAFARVIQGFGYAFLFVPVSVLAYSYLPANKNNKASSLTNLARNWGGSFGVAFTTTMHERRMDARQNDLGAALNSAASFLQERLSQLTSVFEQRGFSHAGAMEHARGLIDTQLGQQASLEAFMDCFRLLAAVAILGIPLAFLIKPFRVGKAGAAH